MTDKEKLLNAYLKSSEIALDKLKKEFEFLNSNYLWEILIYEYEHFDNPSDVLFENLSTKDIINCIEQYFTTSGLLILNIKIENSIVPKELSTDLIKAKVKHKGEIWTIHKNDQDTFPSQPHAHNYDKQFKLHLGNGKLYRKKVQIGSIRNDDLFSIRQKISQIIDT